MTAAPTGTPRARRDPAGARPPGAPTAPSGSGTPRPAGASPVARRPRLPWRVLRWAVTEAKVFFVLALAGYLTLALHQTIVSGVFFNDALIRFANAENVLYSYDPHLAAIGFTFGPIPSFVMLPFTPLTRIWPELLQYNVLPITGSALWMAGSVGLCSLTLRALGVPRITRWALVLVYALNPVVVIFGANGMSEATLLFFLMAATLHMVRWLGGAPHPVRHLLLASLAVSGAYLTRFEALFAGISLLILVPVVAWLRGPSKKRRERALMDLTLFGLPFLSVVVVWAVTTKVIIGDWIGYLSESYGQTAGGGESEIIARVGSDTVAGRIAYLAEQSFALAPLLVAALAAALVLVPVRRDLRQIAPVATMGAVAVSAGAAFLVGASSGLLRYEITVVPLAVLLAGAVAGSRRIAADPVADAVPVPGPAAEAVPWYRSRLAVTAVLLLGVDALAGVLAVALAAPALITSTGLVQDRALATQETRYVEFLRDPAYARSVQGRDVGDFGVQHEAAAFVDRLGAPPGSILTDAAVNAAIMALSEDRKAYLSTSDRSFERTVADPVRFGIEYVLLSARESARFDAVRNRFPQLAAGQPGSIAELVTSFGVKGNELLLYRLNDTVQGQSDLERAP